MNQCTIAKRKIPKYMWVNWKQECKGQVHCEEELKWEQVRLIIDLDSSLALQKSVKTKQTKQNKKPLWTERNKKHGKKYLYHCWYVGSINIQVNSVQTSHMNEC